MAHKNQNQKNYYGNSQEQPEGWFDPESYSHSLDRRNEDRRSNNQQTINPNLVNRYEDLNRQRFQNEYENKNDFNRQYGNMNNGNRREYNNDRNTPRSSMYGDNFEQPVRMRNENDDGYRNGHYRGGRDYPGYKDHEAAGREERDWWDKASDEVASWFGNDQAENRRKMDKLHGPHSGKGPKGYSRTDEKIKDEICERLYHDSFVDASDVEINVENGEVILTGTIENRDTKRRIEGIVESTPGVKDVENRLKINQFPTTSSNLSISEKSNMNDSNTRNR